MKSIIKFMIKKLRFLILPTISALLLIVGFTLNAIGNKNFGDDIFIFSIILIGTPLIKDIIKEFLGGKYNVDIIALISIVGSLLVKQYLAGAIIVLMLSGGEALENYAEQKAKSALQRLLNLAPKIAHKYKDKNLDEAEDVKVENLKIYDKILIKPDEIIPIDCSIILGNTTVDQSNLTGESLPIEKGPGDKLMSGSVNQNGIIKAVVTKDIKNSAFSQILELIKDSEKNKAKINRLADFYGAIFTPIVLIFALLVFLLSKNLEFTYAVFVIATPCPLLLATPIAIISGIAKAAKRGIIIKNGNALESFARSNVLVFDKTGTLTEGNPKVVEVKSLNSNYPIKKVLTYAACLNQFSSHILAQPIVNALKDKDLFNFEIMDFDDVKGKGVKGFVDNKKVLVGSLGFLEENEINIDEKLRKIKDDENIQGNIISFVAIDNEISGYIILSDELRKDSPRLIKKLREFGFRKLVLASGDVKIVAEKIAKQTGIKTVYFEVKPEQKAEIINNLNKEGYIVAMVGDGVNDAPAMALANVGIAIDTHGSTAATDASDIVIMTGNISRVAELVIISRKTISIAKQSIFLGMFLSFIGMFFAGIGVLPPALGATLQEVIDLFAILNALKVLKIDSKNI